MNLLLKILKWCDEKRIQTNIVCDISRKAFVVMGMYWSPEKQRVLRTDFVFDADEIEKVNGDVDDMVFHDITTRFENDLINGIVEENKDEEKAEE